MMELLLFCLSLLYITQIDAYISKLNIKFINSNLNLNNFILKSDISSNSLIDYGKCPGAAKCKGEYRDKGCDGSGKIQGGIATIPLFSWWPIKVYRPCPSYQDAGYVYRREGQTLDQVLFSEPSTKMQEKMAEIRAAEAEAAKAIVEAELNLPNKNNDDSSSSNGSGDGPYDNTTDAENQFLEDAFGKD